MEGTPSLGTSTPQVHTIAFSIVVRQLSLAQVL